MRPITPNKKPRPFTQGQTSSGFPSPAEDYEEPPLDLHDLVVVNPPATYFMRADTRNMIQSGIQPGDILTIDRSIVPTESCIVIAVIEDMFHVKNYRASTGDFILTDDKETLRIDPGNIWGVVTYITRKV